MSGGVTQSPPPDAERRFFGPPDDQAILPWYDGAYSRAFIALHPFFAVEGLDPATCVDGPLVLDADDSPQNLGLIEWLDRENARQRVGKELDEDAVDDIAKLFGSTIAWQAMAARADIADHRGLNRALRTGIGGLRAELADHPAEARLRLCCVRDRIFRPATGVLPPPMERGLVDLFRRARLDEIVMGDEFGDQEHVVDVAALDMPTSWRTSSLPIPFPRRLFARDGSLLVSVHWDSFFTIILGTEERLSGVGIDALFEGFWASVETSIGWLFQPAIPLAR
ncbi:hypothetical protein QH494_23050 [Sphingomonas sp. AR_OL41]|uniref:hypothetical protein n=1 Tax=Sphingomonas sp. AR_OL41 TaxID=3042729 RepID=UPI002481339D|nr:hypothetical protein [Sphingomonas sp. AR_OL41]MDH7975072.1 hypothetical protein [Sphingomonas sp. AR_OL41]